MKKFILFAVRIIINTIAWFEEGTEAILQSKNGKRISPFSDDLLYDLVECSVRINFTKYIAKLYSYFISFTSFLADITQELQQYNVSWFMSKPIEQKFWKEEIRALSWPGLSPHLQLFENLWDVLSRKFVW